MCYKNEKGKSTYLSHVTDAYNCPTKLKLNIMVEDGRKVKAKGKRKKAARLEIFLNP